MIEALPIGAFSDPLILGMGQMHSICMHNFCQILQLMLDSTDISFANNICNYILEFKIKTEDFLEGYFK